MEEIRYIPQAKQPWVSNSDQNKNVQYSNLLVKSDTVELNVKNNNKKVIKITAITAATLAAAAGAFVIAKKGVLGESLKKSANSLWNNVTSIFKKTPAEVSTTPKPDDKPMRIIRKFISNGSEIDGVKLEKGKAILSDGSMYTGTMETVTKSGNKVVLDYENGFLTKSTINNKLFKTFEKPVSYLDRANGVLIKQYDDSGKIIKQSCRFYSENGKLYKIMSRGENDSIYNVLEFSPNGKIIAKYETDLCGNVNNGKVFYERGTVKRVINCDKRGIRTSETVYLPDGTKTVKYGGYYHSADYPQLLKNEQLAATELDAPNTVELFDKEGKVLGVFRCDNDAFGGGVKFRICTNYADTSPKIEMTVPKAKELSKKSELLPGDIDNNRVCLRRKFDNGNTYTFTSIDVWADIIKESKSKGFTRDSLLATLDELEQGIKVAEDNHMLKVIKGEDYIEMSYDKFRKYIKQLKDYAAAM